jgi:RNA-splicing ligase RtcB
VLEAFQEIIPGVKGSLVYFISHNIARREIVANQECWVHRKGATRAFPANHFALKEHAILRDGPSHSASRQPDRRFLRDGGRRRGGQELLQA